MSNQALFLLGYSVVRSSLPGLEEDQMQMGIYKASPFVFLCFMQESLRT